MTSSIFQRVQEIANGFHLDPSVTVELLDFGYEVASEAYARGCADQHERTKAEAVRFVKSAEIEADAKLGASTHDNSARHFAAASITCRTIAAAIEKMERPV